MATRRMPVDLTTSIKDAVTNAQEKCEGLKWKDLVILIGSTGSGKTTLVNYLLKNKIKIEGRKLQAEKVLPGFEMSDQYASVTRGVEAAHVSPRLCIVDTPGTGDTEGEIREVEGAIFRSSLLRVASTVRIVQVFSLSRLKMDRGKLLVQDLEHIARMLEDMPGTPAGMVLTAEPDLLKQEDAAKEMMERMQEGLPRIIEKVKEGTLETKVPAVVPLLQCFKKHLDEALNTDNQVLGIPSDTYRAVYPANVISEKHRPRFLEFLEQLPAIDKPAEALACPLPQACQSELSATLGKMSQDIRRAVHDKGALWAADTMMLGEVVDLLHLASILTDLKLLDSAPDLQKELVDTLSSDAKWDAGLVNQVCGVLECVDILGDAGSKLLKHWADELAKHGQKLKVGVMQCKVLHALDHSEELHKHLPCIAKVLGPHCEALQGLHDALKTANEDLWNRLTGLSNKMLTEGCASDELEQFCRSTELKAHFGQDLEAVFITTPLAAALTPKQDDVDEVCKLLQDADVDPELWSIELKDLATKAESVRQKLGVEVLKNGETSYSELMRSAKEQAEQARETVTRELSQLRARAEGYDTGSARSDGPTVCISKVSMALRRLVALQSGDLLLRLFSQPLHDRAERALQVVFGQMRTCLKTCLTAARGAESTFCFPGAVLATEVVDAMGSLKVCASLAGVTLDVASDSCVSDTLECIRKDLANSTELIESVLEKELGRWAEAEAGARDWTKVFAQNLRTAGRLKPLSPQKIGPRMQQIQEAVHDWQKRCFQAAEAAAGAGNWREFIEHAVQQGMAFESSDLFGLVGTQLQLEFHSLVEDQVNAWRQAAEASQNPSKREHWNKFSAMHTALGNLRGLGPEPMIAKLRSGLDVSLQQLQASFTCKSKELLDALEGKQFARAEGLLVSASDPASERALLTECLKQYTEHLREDMKCGEDAQEAAKAIRDAQKLIRDIGKFTDDEAKRGAEECKASLTAELDSKKEEAKKRLLMALRGHGSPDRWLAIGATLAQRSKEQLAEEMLSEFKESATVEFRDSSLPALSRWASRHSGVRNKLPPEFKACATELEELMEQFWQRFSRASLNERNEMDDCMRRKMWGEAKAKREMIREAVEKVIELEILEGKAKDLRRLKSSVGLVPGDDGPMRKDLEQGDFRAAVHSLVTSGNQERTEKICSWINTKLDAHKNVKAADGTVNCHNLHVLMNFLQEVGDNPPDELRELCTSSQLSCSEVDVHADKQMRDSLKSMGEAAASNDLSSMAKALVRVNQFEFRMKEQHLRVAETAKQSFWKGISQVVDKVGKHIEALDATSLALSEKPLGKFMQAFADLRQEEKEALMASLKSEHPVSDLQSWICQCLAPCLRDLLDKGAMTKQTMEQDFKKISLRYKVSQRLHKSVQSDVLDLAPLKDHLEQRRAQAALACEQRDLFAFNKGFKLLRMARDDLPEACLGRHVADLEQVFGVKVLQPFESKIREVRSIPDAAGALIAFRCEMNDVQEAYELVKASMSKCVRALRGTLGPRSFAELGLQLSMSDFGCQITAEHEEIFRKVREMSLTSLFRKAGETDLDTFVQRLDSQPALAQEERNQLKGALVEHEAQFERLYGKYLLKNKSIDEVLMEAKRDLYNKVEQATNLDNKEENRALLTQLVASYVVQRCGKAYLEASTADERRDVLAVPHRAQMLVLFRLLQLHKPDKKPRRSSKQSDTAKPVLPNHLAQMLTGEGKCLTLGLLAAFLALKGTGSDIVCYSKILSEQDRCAMEPFLAWVGVEQQVRYATPDELCSHRLDAITAATKTLLESGQSPQKKSKVMDNSRRALIIDEVDVLFGRAFYGKIWNGGFLLSCPEAQALVKFVFNEVEDGRAVDNRILRSSVFGDLTARFPLEMHSAFAGTALALAHNIKSWANPEPVPSPDGKQVGYKEGSELSFDVSYANKTVFAILAFEKENRISAEVASKKVGIDLLCGRFSFAELPKSYSFILGVTGTLQELLPVDGISKVIQEDYKIADFTFAPSVFGERRLTFKEGEHVDVLPSEADWISHVEQLAQDERRAGNAVLVFFKNSEMLKKFPQCDDFSCLHERTDPDQRNAYIMTATGPGRITLCTRGYGRGIDFTMPTAYQVVVVQTFLSSCVSETTQIKGRTARHGQPGLYRLVLCKEHLERKMAFTSEEVEELGTGSGEQIKRLLATKQSEKTANKATTMNERKRKALELERETKEWEALLFDAQAPVARKMRRLAEWNTNVAHYTLLLDNSISMRAHWDQLVGAFTSFHQALQKHTETEARTTVSVVLFNETASTIMDHVGVREVESIQRHQCDGRTDFERAFEACHSLMGKSRDDTKEFLLFMTDGFAPFPAPQLERLLADHGARMGRVTCVAFGAKADARCLRQISVTFEAGNVPCTVKCSADAASLVEAFTEAAESLPIHHSECIDAQWC